jgi:phosphatidylcholine synthase
VTGPLAKIKPWVADALTLSNGVFGFLSLLTWVGELGPLSHIPNPVVAGAYIGLGMVADGLDGPIARVWGSQGVGDALDSINDAITFSVAPAVFLVAVNQMAGGVLFRTVLSLTAVALVLSGMIRLVRHREAEAKPVFQGLPTPWSAATLVVVLLVGVPHWAAVGLAAGLAILNVSSVPYPKTRGATFTRAALVLVAISVTLIGAMVVFPDTSTPFMWGAAVLAVGLFVFAPLAAPPERV